MAEYLAIDLTDFDRFGELLDERTKWDNWTVVSSNAYYDGQSTRYYALLEKDGLRHKIASELSSIESNTNN